MAVALVSALALTLGCGSGNQPAQSSAIVSGSASAVLVGNRVGNRIPSFTMSLPDGSLVTSDGLLNQNRGTFLLFFKQG
jgi:hypothetical protein